MIKLNGLRYMRTFRLLKTDKKSPDVTQATIKREDRA